MAATAVTMSLTGLVLRPVVVAKPRRCSHVTRASTSTSLSTIAFARLGRVGLAGACRANVTPKGPASTRGSDTRQRAARPGAPQRKDGHTEQTASGLESSPDDRSRDASAETPPQGGVSIFFKPITERALPAGLALGGAGVFGSGLQLDGPASTAEAIVVLASIIFVHECGHFFAARSQNIHVSKFSVGFGPSLLSYQGPEVEYSLRLIPLGGFVAFPDDDPDCPYPEDDPDLLRNRPTKDRAIVVSAGVAANVVFALSILLVQVNTVGLVTQTYAPGVRVTNLTQTSAAREYGVLQGDVITKVNGRVLTPDRASVAFVVDSVRSSGSDVVVLDVDRTVYLDAANKTAPSVKSLKIEVTPSLAPSGEGRIGAQLEANAVIEKRKASGFEAVKLATTEFTRLTVLVATSLFSLVSDFDKAKENVSGPIAIVGVGAEVMRGSDLTGLYQFASVININLAVVNILPLPALDGGFLLLIAIEALRGGKKLPTAVEQSITASGVLLLLGSGMFLILRDTLNLFNGK